MTHIYWI